MKYALVNGRILNGHEDMEVIEGQAILIDDQMIVGLVEHQHIPSDYRCIDVQNQYIMPGLINLHVHLPSSGKPSKKQVDMAKLVKFVTKHRLTRQYLQSLCEKSAMLQLLSGVTTIRTMGGVTHYDTLIRDRILKGEIMGPRILASNMAISVPGGHMAGSLAYAPESEQEVVQCVKAIAKDHPDVIKLMITGGVLDAKKKGEPGVLKMPASFVQAACQQAHALGYQVAAHVESSEGVRVALENGVDTIEHGAFVDDELIALFKERKAAHVATLSPALPFALFDGVDEMTQYNGKIVFDGIIQCAKSCLDNGILVGLGTDTGCPYITHYDIWREVNYFHKYCGVSNKFALYTATLNNARIAHIDYLVGSIDASKVADLIVMKDNPLEDLEALRNLSMVICRGTIIDDLHIKKMKNVEEKLDLYK